MGLFYFFHPSFCRDSAQLARQPSSVGAPYSEGFEHHRRQRDRYVGVQTEGSSGSCPGCGVPEGLTAPGTSVGSLYYLPTLKGLRKRRTIHLRIWTRTLRT